MKLIVLTSGPMRCANPPSPLHSGSPCYLPCSAIAQMAITLAIWVGGQQILTGAGLTVGELVTFNQ